MRTRLLALAALAVSACGSPTGYSSLTSSRSSDDGSPSTIVQQQGAQPTSTGLTAGTWDDTINFAHFSAYRAKQENRLVDFTDAEHAQAAAATRSVTTALDVALVIDTTGSMGDEISYLTDEFKGLSAALAEQHPGVPQRWALVHYRDVGDEYVVRNQDFTSDAAAFGAELAELAANGGGDFPEAADQGLAQAATLSWSESPSTARLAFWLADAPPHDKNAGAFSTAVRALRERGVHLYPVASSGVDERTEFAMRASAQLTLGRYLFLTDDSGIGGSHLTPSVPCYVVTTLVHAIERVVASELAGTRVGARLVDVIRTEGSPVDGQCTLDDGTTVQLF